MKTKPYKALCRAGLRSAAFMGSASAAAVVAASLSGCGVDAMGAAATAAALQAQQASQAKAQSARILEGFQAAGQAGQLRLANPEEPK